MNTEDLFTRVNSDYNGNPRFVIHFLQCEPESFKTNHFADRYAATCKLMNKIGGRKFHNKQYGGGIVFSSYNLTDTLKSINELKEEN